MAKFPAVLWNKLTRKKVIDLKDNDTELARVLTTFDLTLLGIGSTLGVGIYVLAGSVARNLAGPAVVISFFIAAVASVLAGLCYAEFGARVPKAGSAYIYSYVCVGELIAFIVGWNLIMEYVIGVASVARGYSGYVDSLFNGEMQKAFETLTVDLNFVSVTFDFFAFTITLVLTFILAMGVKESTIFNNIFTCLNLGVVLFVIIAGSLKADPGNWNISLSDVNTSSTDHHGHKIEPGVGSFAPFGFGGIMKGAATCFYGFVGFDVIATTGEEAKNPQRAIPLAIIFSLMFVFVAYFGVSTVITMMTPYYLQDIQAPLPYAFQYTGFEAGKYIVSVGALFGLSTSLLGSMFPLPRVIWAMANDGLLFAFLSKIHPRFKTPFIATIISGIFGALMAGLFNIEVLIDMMSIGTLTAYTLVAVCVLILRYKKEPSESEPSEPSKYKFNDYLYQIVNLNGHGKGGPTDLSTNYSAFAVLTFCILSLALCSVAIFGADLILDMNYYMIALLSAFVVLEALLILSLALQPVSRTKLSFRVPLVPYIPALSIITNVYLILKLSGATWIRFFVWMLIGFIIYAYCLISGRADKVYASTNPANKRKYSRISLNVINTNTLPPGNSLRSKPDGSSRSDIELTRDGKLSTNSKNKLSSIFNDGDGEKPRPTSIVNNNFRLSFTGIRSPRPMSEGHQQTTSFSAKYLNSTISSGIDRLTSLGHIAEGQNTQPILKKIVLISSSDENPTPHLEFKPIAPAPRAQAQDRESNGRQAYLYNGDGENFVELRQKVSDSKPEELFGFYPEEGASYPKRNSKYYSGNRDCYILNDANNIQEVKIYNTEKNLGKSGEKSLGLGAEDNKKVVDDHKLKVSPEVGQDDAIQVLGIEEFEIKDIDKANPKSKESLKVFNTWQIPATVMEKNQPLKIKPPIVNIIEIQADVNQVDVDDDDCSNQIELENEQNKSQTVDKGSKNEGKENQNKVSENQTKIQVEQVDENSIGQSQILEPKNESNEGQILESEDHIEIQADYVVINRVVDHEISEIQFLELKDEPNECQNFPLNDLNKGMENQSKDHDNLTEIRVDQVAEFSKIPLFEPTNEPNNCQIFGSERQINNLGEIQADSNEINRVVGDEVSNQTQVLELKNEPNEGQILDLEDNNKDHDNQVELSTEEASNESSLPPVKTASNSNNNKQSGNNRRRKRR